MKAANLLCKALSAGGADDGTAPLGAATSGGGARLRTVSGDVGRPKVAVGPADDGDALIPVGAAGAATAGVEEGYGDTGVTGGAAASGSLTGFTGAGDTNGGGVWPKLVPGPAAGRTAVGPKASGPPGGGDGLALGNSTLGTAGHPSATPCGGAGSTLFRISDS